MGNKTQPGSGLSQTSIDATVPFGEVGVNLAQDEYGAARTDRWMLELHLYKENAQATLDLGGVDTGQLDSTVGSRLPGTEGNGIQIVLEVADALTVVDDMSANVVTITFVDGVTTVGDVEAAITADSTLIEVTVPGTAATVLVAADEIALGDATITGGTDTATTSDAYVWGRVAETRRWCLVNDVYGHIVKGKIATGIANGSHAYFLRDVGNFDRLYVTGAPSASGVMDAKFYPLHAMGHGS